MAMNPEDLTVRGQRRQQFAYINPNIQVEPVQNRLLNVRDYLRLQELERIVRQKNLAIGILFVFVLVTIATAIVIGLNDDNRLYQVIVTAWFILSFLIGAFCSFVATQAHEVSHFQEEAPRLRSSIALLGLGTFLSVILVVFVWMKLFQGPDGLSWLVAGAIVVFLSLLGALGLLASVPLSLARQQILTFRLGIPIVPPAPLTPEQVAQNQALPNIDEEDDTQDA